MGTAMADYRVFKVGANALLNRAAPSEPAA